MRPTRTTLVLGTRGSELAQRQTQMVADGLRARWADLKLEIGAITDTIAGRVDSAINTTGSLLQTVRSGQLRALAVTTRNRFPTAPELPTISESGVPGFDVSSWYALFVPAKTPAEIIAKLNAATVTALSEPAVRARFEPLGVVVESSTPEEMGALLQSEIDKWGPIIKAAGISASN